MKKPITLVLLLVFSLLLFPSCTQTTVDQVVNEVEKEVAQETAPDSTGQQSVAPVPTPSTASTVPPPPGDTGTTTTGTTQQAFETNGDLISGWYWVRDKALKQYAQWRLVNVPDGNGDLDVQMEVLATNTFSGGRGYDAKFKVFYDNTPIASDSPSVTVTLKNVSPASDPVGYTCRGSVSIPRSALGVGTTLYLKAMRSSATDNHVAFNKESIKNFTTGSGTSGGQLNDQSGHNTGDTTGGDATGGETTGGDNQGGGQLIEPELDSDNDFVTDKNEQLFQTDPNNPDTDGDGLIDGKDLSPLIKPNTPGFESNQKVGMVRIEQPIKAYGLDGWVETYYKHYGFFSSWMEYLDTYYDEGTKRSIMDEAHYKEAVNKVFETDDFVAYRMENVTPAQVAVEDSEWTADQAPENSYTFAAGFFHPNEYRFYYDYLTDYQRAYLKNNAEIKYPADDNYFQYLTYPIKMKTGLEQTISVQFDSPAAFAGMNYQDDQHYKLPGFIYSLYKSGDFNDDTNLASYENLAVATLEDQSNFVATFRIPKEKATASSGQIKITPVWVEKNGNSTVYNPLHLAWDLRGLTRDIVYQRSSNGNSKVVSEEFHDFADLNNSVREPAFFSGQSGANVQKRSEWQGVVKHDPQAGANEKYEVMDMTETITTYAQAGGGMIQSLASLTENMVTAVNKVDDISSLPANHWARSPKYGGAMAGVAAINGVASMVASGQSAWVAYKEGEAVNAIYYAAQTGLTAAQTTQALVQISENTLGMAGKAGKLAKITSKKASVGLAAAIGVVEISYDVYNLANTDDPILETAYSEKIAGDTINTGISIAAVFSPHTLAFQLTWTIEAELYGAIFGEDFAYRVASSPGSAVVFLVEYFITGTIPSQMATDAYTDIREELITQIDSLNEVPLPYMSIFIDPDL